MLLSISVHECVTRPNCEKKRTIGSHYAQTTVLMIYNRDHLQSKYILINSACLKDNDASDSFTSKILYTVNPSNSIFAFQYFPQSNFVFNKIKTFQRLFYLTVNFSVFRRKTKRE